MYVSFGNVGFVCNSVGAECRGFIVADSCWAGLTGSWTNANYGANQDKGEKHFYLQTIVQIQCKSVVGLHGL